MYLSIALLLFLFWASSRVWRELITRRRNGQPFLEFEDVPRTTWSSFPEQAVVAITILWLTVHLVAGNSRKETVTLEEFDLRLVISQAVVNFGLAIILPLILKLANRSWSSLGYQTAEVRRQIRIGEQGFLASVIPMATTMVLTLPLRPPEVQNPLLKLLRDSPSSTTVLIVAVTAVLSAPVLEELLFRVILQGWLVTRLDPKVSIIVVATIFCLVHGWRDGLALVPLALILGYVFERCHSYLTVVVIHALFNATMLIFQLLIPDVS